MATTANILSLRNNLYLGNFHAVITEASKSNDSIAQFYSLFSLFLSKQYDKIINSDIDETNLSLSVILLYAKYKKLMITKESCSLSFSEIAANCKDKSDIDSISAKLIISLFYIEIKHYKECLELCINKNSLELLACSVICYIVLHRFDLADKKLRQMKEIDDDDVLTCMFNSYLNLTDTNNKATDSHFILQELVEKNGNSAYISLGLALSKMHSHNFSEALELLKESKEISLSNNEPILIDVLINQFICHQYLNKPTNPILEEIKSIDPDNKWLSSYNELGNTISSVISSYST